MVSPSQLLPVQLSSINLKDRTYCLAPWEDTPPSEKLMDSIKRFGILHPPIIQQADDNSYGIVAGRRRVIAAQHLAPDHPVLCRIIPANIEKKIVFSLLLEEATAGTPLSFVEQIVFFEKLVPIVPTEDALPLLEQLGHKPQKHILDGLLKLRSLHITVLQALHDGIIPLKNARKLLNLSKTDQETIARHITALHLRGSKQQKLIDLCTELIMRRNIPLKQILADFPFTEPPEKEENIPQLGTALLLWLQGACFPQSSRAESNFKSQVARLNLPPTMQIDHTPAFENEETTLSLRFPDLNSLEKALEGIRNIMLEK